MKNIYKRENKVLNISLMMLRNICLALLITLVGAFALGYKFLNIVTDSMTPTMPRNTIIMIKHIPIEQVEIGDVVTYKTSSGNNVTHRVDDIKGSGKFITLVTRGDNPSAGVDQKKTVEKVTNPSSQNEYVGVVIAYVKDMGVLLKIIKDNIIIITVCIVLALFIITYS